MNIHFEKIIMMMGWCCRMKNNGNNDGSRLGMGLHGMGVRASFEWWQLLARCYVFYTHIIESSNYWINSSHPAQTIIRSETKQYDSDPNTFHSICLFNLNIWAIDHWSIMQWPVLWDENSSNAHRIVWGHIWNGNSTHHASDLLTSDQSVRRNIPRQSRWDGNSQFK